MARRSQPRRQRRVPPRLFAAYDVQLLSGWQGDNAGGTSVPDNVDCVPPYVAPCAAPVFAHHYVQTPVLTGVTGQVLGRIINRSGTNQPLNVMGNPIPYFPANSADNSNATLKEHLSETINGVVTEGATIPNSDWKFCYGAGATFVARIAVGRLARACVPGKVAASTPRSSTSSSTPRRIRTCLVPARRRSAT